jgi:transposase
MSVTASVVPVSHAVRVEQVPDPQVPERASRRSYSAKYKAAILAEYEGLDRGRQGCAAAPRGLVQLADQRVA